MQLPQSELRKLSLEDQGTPKESSPTLGVTESAIITLNHLLNQIQGFRNSMEMDSGAKIQYITQEEPGTDEKEVMVDKSDDLDFQLNTCRICPSTVIIRGKIKET